MVGISPVLNKAIFQNTAKRGEGQGEERKGWEGEHLGIDRSSVSQGVVENRKNWRKLIANLRIGKSDRVVENEWGGMKKSDCNVIYSAVKTLAGRD